MDKHDAILLLGPTGSGKTPLGRVSETAGFDGRRCVHFDFGQELRRAASAEIPPPALAAGDIAIIRHVLADGALLEDDTFYIAEAILRQFIEVHAPSPDVIVVLNGLPRHLGQWHRLDPLLRIIRAVHLHCLPETVFERIRINAGGDRNGRADDTPDAIRRKLAIFEQRTAPILDECRRRRIPVIVLDIPLRADPVALWTRIAAAPPDLKTIANP